MVAGKEASPEDAKNTDKLRAYWEHGEGGARIQWGVPGDFARCVAELRKHISDPEGYCALMHHRVTSGWPGHAPGVEQAMAEAKKNKGKNDN